MAIERLNVYRTSCGRRRASAWLDLTSIMASHRLELAAHPLRQTSIVAHLISRCQCTRPTRPLASSRCARANSSNAHHSHGRPVDDGALRCSLPSPTPRRPPSLPFFLLPSLALSPRRRTGWFASFSPTSSFFRLVWILLRARPAFPVSR